MSESPTRRFSLSPPIRAKATKRSTPTIDEAGYGVFVAAPSKRRLHLVMHDFEPGWDTYVERPGYGLESHLTFAEVMVAGYEAVLILGGGAPA